MASVQTSKYDGRYLKLTVTEESTSIENNTSTIKWLLESIGGNSNYYNIYDCKVTVNGQVVYGPVTKTWDSKVFPAAKGSTSGTITITHNADGTAPNVSFTLRGSVFNNSPQNYSDSIPLTTIPRASSITVLDANIGSSTNITINKASSNFTTTLYYKASGQSSWTKIVDKTSNQVYGWTVPTSFYSLIPNSKTIACQFYAETYLDGNYVGTSSIITAIFTATGIPTINSIAAIDTNSTTINLTGNSANMIRYASNVKITVSASGVNSASISSIKVNGTTASSGVVTFNSCTTNSFEIVVTDSRGYTRTQTKTMTMVNYVPLTLSAIIERNLPTDGKVKISYSGNYFNGSFGSQSNTLTVQYRYKLKGGSFGSWTNLSPSKSGNTYSQSNYIISGFDYTKQYEFEIKAIDKINTVSIIGISVSKGKPVLYWEDELVGVNGTLRQNGVGVATLGNNTFQGLQSILANGKTVVIGAQNTSFCHFINNENIPFYFNRDVHVAGNVYGGSNYNQILAYKSEVPTNNNQLTNGRGFTTFDCTAGTSGIWTYLKFSNGYAICFGVYEFSATINTTWGNLKNAASAIQLPNFPFTFTTIPVVTVTPTNTSNTNYMWIVGNNGASNVGPSTTQPGRIMATRGSGASSSQKYACSIIAIGKWT